MPTNQSPDLLAEGLQKLTSALEEARAAAEPEPYVMSLATVDAAGKPSIRSILLANINARGLLFFVNTRSGKGLQLQHNPNVALCFFWRSVNLQVVVEGIAEQEGDAEASRIWSKRARANQIAAWASNQSEPSRDNEALATRVAEANAEFRNQRVPLPAHWAGYRVLPTRIEFWRAGWRHMKDRVRYQQEGGSWSKTMLDP